MKTLVLAILAVAAASTMAPQAMSDKQTAKTQIVKPLEARAHKVVVYSRDYCTYCHKLIANLNAMGIKHTVINATGSYPPFVPLMIVDGKTYVGYKSISELKRILS